MVNKLFTGLVIPVGRKSSIVSLFYTIERKFLFYHVGSFSTIHSVFFPACFDYVEQIYGGRIQFSAGTPQLGYLGPHPLFLTKNWIFFFLLKTHKHFSFSYYLTTVQPAYKVFKIRTVYIWVGPKIPQLGYLGPHPLVLAKNWKFFFLLKTHKHFCFSDYLTTVLPAYDLFFFDQNSIYLSEGQDTPAGVSWPPPPSPSQKLEKKILLKRHKHFRFSDYLTTVLPANDLFFYIKTVYI